jgi:hypothetical protein
MKIDQNPFSIYDFLGYLIPGLLFSYGSIFILNINIDNPFVYQKLNLELDQYFIIIIISYLVGHILSYLSSVSVELYSIWTIGYPSRYLLNLNFPGFWRNILKEKEIQKRLLKLLMVSYIFPVAICDIFVRKVFKVRNLLGKPIDPIMSDLVHKKVNEYLITNFTEDDMKEINESSTTDFFNLIYHYTLEKSPAHVSKLNNYVALYGFTRTLCFAFITLSWIVLIKGFGGVFSWKATSVILILSIFASILYLDFNKFYRKYSLEALMAFVSNYNTKNT